MAQLDEQAPEQVDSAPPEPVTVRLAPEDIAALATAIAEAKVRIAREDIAALAAAITKGLHEKLRSPNFQFDVLHRLPVLAGQRRLRVGQHGESDEDPRQGEQPPVRARPHRRGDGARVRGLQGREHQRDRHGAARTARSTGSTASRAFRRSGRVTTSRRRPSTRAASLPKVKENVELHKGWFNESLPPFLEQHPGPVAFIHVDCDLYSSTKTLLDLLAPRIRPGTVDRRSTSTTTSRTGESMSTRRGWSSARRTPSSTTTSRTTTCRRPR